MPSLLITHNGSMKIAKSERDFPKNEDYVAASLLIDEHRKAWLLSCDQSGNLWEVAKEDVTKFCNLLGYEQSKNEAFMQSLHEGIVIPDTCYVLRPKRSPVVAMTKKGLQHFDGKYLAYFKDDAPANETETGELKYRLGRKQERAILEVATGHEYLVFPQAKKHYAKVFLHWLNGDQNTLIEKLHNNLHEKGQQLSDSEERNKQLQERVKMLEGVAEKLLEWDKKYKVESGTASFYYDPNIYFKDKELMQIVELCQARY